MAADSMSGMQSGKRRARNVPSRLELGNTAGRGKPYVRDVPGRQPHDSVLDSSSRVNSSLRSPFTLDGDYDSRERTYWRDQDGSDPYSLTVPKSAGLLPPPRKESLHISAATSPLARTLDDDFLTATGSPPRKASAGSSPNIGQELWWRSDSRPGSSQPSPRFLGAMDPRSSAASAMPAPGFAGVSNMRVRGMTASSAHSPAMHHSASYGDLRMSNRTLPNNVYRPSRRPDDTRDSAHSGLRREHFVPPFAEGSRSSVRSAWTTHSSGFLGSDRSSVMTRASSTSELNRVNPPLDDLLMSVEDAINMYTMGFDDSADEGLDDEVSHTEAARNQSSSPMSQYSTFEEGTSRAERTPVLQRSSSDPSAEPLTVASARQRSETGPSISHGRRNLSDALEGSHGDAVTDTPLASPRDQHMGYPPPPPPFPDLESSSLPLHEPPSFANSPTQTPPTSSQPRTPSSSATKDDVFSPAKPERPPRPPDQEPLPYLPLPEKLRKSKEEAGSTGIFTNPRAAPELPTPLKERDRYGFHKATQYITVQQYDEWNEQYTPYLARRRVKWSLLMKQHGLETGRRPEKFPARSEKLKRYVRKGIPPEWRGAAWFYYAGGHERLHQHSGLYWSFIEQIKCGMLSDSDREHIERDLNRTFPDNIKFKPDSPPRKMSRDARSSQGAYASDTSMIRALRRVLQAFALYRPNIGYCQSLNFLAGLLLIFLDQDEEKTFIMLDVITSVHLPGTHAKVLEANVDIGVLMTCIQESMPAVWAKIDDNAEEMMGKPRGGPNQSVSRLPTISLATTAWFMSCFIGNLPIECVLRVWDVFFLEGSKTLFRIALTIFKLGEPEIRSITENMEVFQLVQTIPRRLIDANLLMEACYKKRNNFQYLSQDTVDQRRIERRKILAEERARKMGGKGHKFEIAVPAIPDEEPRSRLDVAASGLKRAASRARMKRSQSRRRPSGKE